MKFTKGEWKANPDVRTSINCEGKHICMVNWNQMYLSPEEHFANVRLIENAPKMCKILEMLEQAQHLSNVADDSEDAWIEWLNKLQEIENEFPKILNDIRGL